MSLGRRCGSMSIIQVSLLSANHWTILVIYFLPVPLEIILRTTGGTRITLWKTVVYFF
jgi:hypothetical protein